MTSKEMKRWLTQQGATFTTTKSSHLRVFLNGMQSVLPMHSGDLPKGTELAILKQLGLKKLK
jgi:mRNA interferase HicA